MGKLISQMHTFVESLTKDLGGMAAVERSDLPGELRMKLYTLKRTTTVFDQYSILARASPAGGRWCAECWMRDSV